MGSASSKCMLRKVCESVPDGGRCSAEGGESGAQTCPDLLRVPYLRTLSREQAAAVQKRLDTVTLRRKKHPPKLDVREVFGRPSWIQVRTTLWAAPFSSTAAPSTLTRRDEGGRRLHAPERWSGQRPFAILDCSEGGILGSFPRSCFLLRNQEAATAHTRH